MPLATYQEAQFAKRFVDTWTLHGGNRFFLISYFILERQRKYGQGEGQRERGRESQADYTPRGEGMQGLDPTP